MTRLFPLLVSGLEFLAGLVYLSAWLRQGDPTHGWLALVWVFYGIAAFGLAMVGE